MCKAVYGHSAFNMETLETYLEVVQNGSKEGMVHNPVQPTGLHDH